MPRSARFEWRGFEKHGAPSDGLLLHPDGLLVFGRSKARNQNGPNDAQLLILTEQNEVDPDRSRLFSRRHFELYLECDRLMLRVESEVISKRRSKSRPEMGLFKSRAQIFNQADEVVLEMTSNGLIAVRDPDAPIEG